MQELPALQVTQGAPINDEFTMTAQNLTGWTGIAKFVRRYPRVGMWYWDNAAPDEITMAECMLTVSAGNTTVATTVADTSDFPIVPRIGPFVTAFCEYRLTGPTGAVLVFQRPVAVARAL